MVNKTSNERWSQPANQTTTTKKKKRATTKMPTIIKIKSDALNSYAHALTQVKSILDLCIYVLLNINSIIVFLPIEKVKNTRFDLSKMQEL